MHAWGQVLKRENNVLRNQVHNLKADNDHRRPQRLPKGGANATKGAKRGGANVTKGAKGGGALSILQS